MNQSSPYRLALSDVVRIPHTAPLPPSFDPREDENLRFDEDEEEGGGEAAG